MATIGLKVNHSTAGTDIGGALAKALMPNVGDAVSVARLKMDMATEEIRRRQIQEAASLLTQQTIAQAKKNQYEQAIFNAQTDAGSVHGKILHDSQGRPIAATEAPAVVPDTVLQSGGRGLPEVLTGAYYPPAPEQGPPMVPPELLTPPAVAQPSYGPEPDISFTGYPVRSEVEAPVPVEPEQVVGVPLPLQRLVGQSPELSGPPVPPSMVPPGMLSPVPPTMRRLVGQSPELNGPPVPPSMVPPGMLGERQPVIGGTPPLIGGTPPLIGGDLAEHPAGEPGWFENLARQLGAYGPNAPEPGPSMVPPEQLTPPTPAMVPPDMLSPPPLPPEYFTPPAELDQPVPIEPDMVPPEMLTQQQLPPEYFTPPAELDQPVPIEPPMVPPDMIQQPIPVGEELVTTEIPGREAVPAVTPETTAAITPPAAPPAAVEAPSAGVPAQPTAKLPAPSTITTKAPGSVGTGKVNPDGSSVYQTDQGPVPLTKEETDKLGLAIAYGTDPAGQTGKLAGVLKTIYDPSVTLTPNQKAELLSGVSPIGTPEETASKIAIAKASGDIKTTMIADRAYTLSTTPDGRTVATLVEGQPPAKNASRFGESADGYMRTGISDLMVSKPDPKTWTATEKQDYAIMVDALYGAKVHVTADGTVAVEEGDLPDGVLPGSAGFNPSNPPPPPRSETPPAETQAPPATTAPAPATTAPAVSAPGETARKNASGRYLTEEGYPSYGGYQVKGQKPPEPTVTEAGGKKVTVARPAERTKEAEGQTGKQVSYTRQALEPASYFLKLKKGDIKITGLQSIIKDLAEDTPVEAVINRVITNADDREYYRNVIEMVKDMSHKDSGADVTKSDLVTYRSLYELPIDPTEKDLALLKRSIRSTLRGSREGFVGAVPADSLRAWDAEAGRLGIDLDAKENVPEIGTAEEAPPKKGFKVVKGKVVRE